MFEEAPGPAGARRRGVNETDWQPLERYARPLTLLTHVHGVLNTSTVEHKDTRRDQTSLRRWDAPSRRATRIQLIGLEEGYSDASIRIVRFTTERQGVGEEKNHGKDCHKGTGSGNVAGTRNQIDDGWYAVELSGTSEWYRIKAASGRSGWSGDNLVGDARGAETARRCRDRVSRRGTHNDAPGMTRNWQEADRTEDRRQ